MVLFTVNAVIRTAIEKYGQLAALSPDDVSLSRLDERVDHLQLIRISQRLVQDAQTNGGVAKSWRLDTLLRGAEVYRSPPPPKPEPTPEFKALMSKLRKEEEQRQYEEMLNPPAPAPSTGRFRGGISLHQQNDDEPDEVSYQDVNRQVILIINILVSIIACSVAIWIVARRWSVPQRLGLSFSASTLVAIAEVAIYMGYIRRIRDAKTVEAKKAEKKEVINTWIIDGKSTSSHVNDKDGIRHRKGKHR